MLLEGETSGPPEPPDAPVTGPLFILMDGLYWCKVPGCSKPKKGFARIGAHLSRIHGLTSGGAPNADPPRQAPTRPVASKPYVSVRLILPPAELALVEQTIHALEFAKTNLTGKLAEMDMLAARAEKLGSIIVCLKELL
jgi:hypothetical protein